MQQRKSQGMTYAEVMEQLEGFGTAQNRKIYVRHGANADHVFGVSFANLNILTKKIKTDHTLAAALWQSGNYDARNLATKIADPLLMKGTDAQKWVADIDNYLHASLLGGLLAKSPAAASVMQKFCSSKKEFTKQCGYALLSSALSKKDNFLGNAEDGKEFLKRIESEIHQSPNWARYSMNWALIALGIYCKDLRDLCLDAANRIGKVNVDHGETSCKTPDAHAYIIKASKRHLGC